MCYILNGKMISEPISPRCDAFSPFQKTLLLRTANTKVLVLQLVHSHSVFIVVHYIAIRRCADDITALQIRTDGHNGNEGTI